MFVVKMLKNVKKIVLEIKTEETKLKNKRRKFGLKLSFLRHKKRIFIYGYKKTLIS
jgi:hypothetical protein